MFTPPSTSLLEAISFNHTGVLAFALQTSDPDSSRLMVIFTGIAAISLLVLALVVVGVLIALAVVAAKAKVAVSQTILEVKAKAYPIIEKTNGLIGDLSPTIKGITEKADSLIKDLSPKISGIGDDVHGITTRARNMAEFAEAQLHEFAPAVAAVKQTILDANNTARSANEKTAHQVDRVNEIFTGVLNWTETMAGDVERAIGGPGKKLADFIARVRPMGGKLIPTAQLLWARFTSKRSTQEPALARR